MSDTDSMPLSPNEIRYDHGLFEVAKFRFCSILAQIEIASCFRNDIEPLFHVFDRVMTAPRNPYVPEGKVKRWLMVSSIVIRMTFPSF